MQPSHHDQRIDLCSRGSTQFLERPCWSPAWPRVGYLKITSHFQTQKLSYAIGTCTSRLLPSAFGDDKYKTSAFPDAASLAGSELLARGMNANWGLRLRIPGNTGFGVPCGLRNTCNLLPS